jgi:hypothetical protein
MSAQGTADRELFAGRVKESLERARQYAGRLRKLNTRLLIASVIASAAATLVAGVTAATGPIVGEGIPGWRLACIAAAGFGFVSTLSVGAHQQLGLSDKLADGHQCVARLKFLDLAMATGSRDWDEITKEYESILTAYPEVI